MYDDAGFGGGGESGFQRSRSVTLLLACRDPPLMSGTEEDQRKQDGW